MDKKLKRICIILGIFYYLSVIWFTPFGTDGSLKFIGLVFAWLIPMFLGFLPNFLSIKTNLFSDIKDDFTSPVYKLEKSNWGENVVSKYTVEYSCWDDGWGAFFPYIWIFRFRQYELESSIEICSKNYDKILSGVVSPEAVYLRAKAVSDLKYNSEISAEKELKNKLKVLNKDYYNNLKTQ